MALPRTADSRLLPGEGTSVTSLWNDYLVKIPAEDKEELWVDGAGSTEINDGTEYHLWGVGIDWRGGGDFSYGSNDDAYPESRPQNGEDGQLGEDLARLFAMWLCVRNDVRDKVIILIVDNISHSRTLWKNVDQGHVRSMAKRPGLLRVNRMFLALARELLGRGCVIYVVHAAMVGLKQAGKHNWRPDVLAQEGMRSGGTLFKVDDSRVLTTDLCWHWFQEDPTASSLVPAAYRLTLSQTAIPPMPTASPLVDAAIPPMPSRPPPLPTDDSEGFEGVLYRNGIFAGHIANGVIELNGIRNPILQREGHTFDVRIDDVWWHGQWLNTRHLQWSRWYQDDDGGHLVGGSGRWTWSLDATDKFTV